MLLSLVGLACSTLHGGWWNPRFDLPGANGRIQSLVEFHGALYAVGYFTRIAGVNAPGVARWDGTNWVAVQPGLNATVGAAVATDDAIYFTANQQRLDQPSGLLRWDGNTWSAPGMPQGYRDALRLLLNGTNIYAEVFPYADVNSGTPLHMLAKWDGNSWSILAAASFNPLSGLAFAQDTLYAAGSL